MDEKVKATEDKVKEILSGIVGESMAEFKDAVTSQIEAKVASAVEEKMPKITIHENIEDDAKGGFKSFGHYLKDVVRCDKSAGRHVSKELDQWETIAKAAGTGLSEGDAEYAGHLVPPEFRNQLMVLIEENNDLLPRCTTIPMGSNIIEVPILMSFDQSGGLVHGGIKAYWMDELDEYTASRPKVKKIQMKLKRLGALAHISEELAEDSPQSVAAIVQRGFADGFSFAYSNGLMRGTGAGQMLGILNAPCLVTVAAEVGQGSGTISFENIVKMVSSFYGRNGVFVANPNTFPQLATMNMTTGTSGVPVWMPAGGISGSPFATLFGYPLLFNDACSSVGTKGDICLCDWSQYWIGRKTDNAGIKYSESMHVMFLYDQQTLKFSTRVDGQPSWPTYYTPPQATTSYRSPFVALATR